MFFNKKIKIQIKQPCSESWESMQIAEKGRFCDACCKKVIDFTTMSEREITSYLKSSNPTNLCGRFKNTQLEHTYIIKRELQFSSQKRFFQYLISLLLSSKTFINKSVAQNDTIKFAQNDSLKLTVVPDSSQTDSITIAESDSLNINGDSLNLKWKQVGIETEIINLDSFVSIGITMGMMTSPYPPPSPEEPLPYGFDFFKRKKAWDDSIASLNKGTISEDNKPEIPREPRKSKHSETIEGVLTEEWKMKSESEI